MKQKLAQFMYGRNGGDNLARFLNYVSIAFLIISMFVGGDFSSLVLFFAVAVLVYTFFRMFSKNITARRAENSKFLRFKQDFLGSFKLRKDMWKQRKDYKFFKCPSCKAVLRVPKGKGTVRIVCKKCGTGFEKKT